MSEFPNLSPNFLDEFEEERIIREYEEECANEEVLDIKKLNLNDRSKQFDELNGNEKFDKCLNISDNEYLENLSVLDNDSDRSSLAKASSTVRQPLYIDTSIPQFVLDNLNKVVQLNMRRSGDCFKEFDDYKELNSSSSTLNSSQLNDHQDDLVGSSSLSNGMSCSENHHHSAKLNHTDHSLKQLNGNSLLNIDSSNNLHHLSSNNNLSSNHSSSNDNLLRNHHDDPSTNRKSIGNFNSTNNFRRKKKTSNLITFEVISARTVFASETLIGYVSNSNVSNKRFIVYTFILKRISGLETQPGIIEKRYSDFSRFFLALRKMFPSLFQDFPFPKKIYSNNFESEVIAERSIVFQHLLTFCLSVRDLRSSAVFYEFILHAEFSKCRRLLRNSAFEEAIICLENLLFILIKLNRIESSRYLQLNIFTTYLALASCFNENESFIESAGYADEAFKMISFNDDFDTNDLTIPFLLLSVQLNSRLNRCCKAQNQKLLDLNDNGITYDKRESLIELFVLKNYFILTP